MKSDTIIVKPKKWFRITNYVASVLSVFVMGYILYQLFNQNSGDPAFVIYLLATMCTIGLIALTLSIPNIHRLKIRLGEDSISKTGVMDREIKFNNIQKVIVRKGGIEIHGNGMLDVISFGDLHQNFEAAVQHLSHKINGQDGIEIKGSDAYIQQYLSGS